MEVKDTRASYASLSELSVKAAPPGYKLTEAGVVPEDWETSTVGVEFSVQLGKMLDAGKNVGTSKPFLGNRAVQWGRIDPSCVGQIKLTARDMQRYRLREGDLLVCEGGEVGRAAIWRNELDECYYQKALHRLRSKNGYNPTLMLNVLHKYAASGVLQNFVTQTSIAHLPKDKFEEVPVPLPGKVEQEAIADALNDADALIESLERLIAKKRQIKQGAMQALLTGKQRLPGFSEDWVVKSLSDLASIRSGGTPSTTQAQFWDGDILWCTPTDITALNGRKYLSDTARKITRQGLQSSSAELIEAKSIVMTSRATIGECAINLLPVTTNQGFKNFIPFDDVDLEFLYYLLLTQKDRFIRLCAGSTFLEIGKAQLASFEVLMPPTMEEQAAISTILSDMDTELAELETRLAKTRKLTQGMMQELLTGRIRLV